MGLAIVKQIVELHGGTVHIESAVYAGTKVYIDLPILS
ncbi:ATP-binding protein [Lysinibacillus sp. GbtcB16]|nr:ATP-binding protein [Lysinibacillus sp. GbtcB16]